MKIYTKTGDKGTTSLFSGERVSKGHLSVETYGTVDELNTCIGLVADQDIPDTLVVYLRVIQNELFVLGSILACGDVSDTKSLKIPELHMKSVTVLEQQIDSLDACLPAMTHFILPGGHPIISYIHLARCVCRRAERLLVRYGQEAYTAPQVTIQYLNRLSDFLFVLARYIAKVKQVEEVKWIP